MKLREADDHRNEDFVEKQRAFMETSEYSKLNTDLTPAETLVFQALVLKRLPVAFKESIGCGDSADFKSAGKIIASNMNAITREFIRSILSEKSVNFSEELAAMLNTVMEERYPHNAEEIAKSLDARYNQSKSNIQSQIDTLRKEIRKEQAAQAEVESDKTESESDDSKAEPATDAAANEVAEEVAVTAEEPEQVADDSEGEESSEVEEKAEE